MLKSPEGKIDDVGVEGGWNRSESKLQWLTQGSRAARARHDTTINILYLLSLPPTRPPLGADAAADRGLITS